MYSKKAPIQIGLTPKQKTLLESYASQYGVSQATIIRLALDFCLDSVAGEQAFHGLKK